MLEQLGGRKFVGFLIAVIALVVLVITGNIAGDAFVSWLTANLGIYILGNVADKLAVQ